MFRIGQGWDFHRFQKKGDHIILGGVNIPFEGSIIAYSDGDILIHALMDALLGAMGHKDIGILFSNTDPKYKGISSVTLLKDVLGILNQHSFQIENIDITLLAEIPKIAPYREAILENLSKILSLKNNQIGMKATTTENMGLIGKKEGIACSVVVLLKKIKDKRENNNSMQPKIFTDGSCLGNPGPGGWCVMIRIPENDEVILSGGEKKTTNNRMELTAVINAMEKLQELRISDGILYTDSNYVKNGITEWIHNWKKNNWLTSKKEEVLNRDLWEILDRLNQDMHIDFLWIEAHKGHPENEKCDQIAKSEAKKFL